VVISIAVSLAPARPLPRFGRSLAKWLPACPLRFLNTWRQWGNYCPERRLGNAPVRVRDESARPSPSVRHPAWFRKITENCRPASVRRTHGPPETRPRIDHPGRRRDHSLHPFPTLPARSVCRCPGPGSGWRGSPARPRAPAWPGSVFHWIFLDSFVVLADAFRLSR